MPNFIRCQGLTASSKGGTMVLRSMGYPMQISRETNDELVKFHEDMAAYFTDEYFPISGETYWTCLECLAIAKLAELRGEVKPDHNQTDIITIN